MYFFSTSKPHRTSSRSRTALLSSGLFLTAVALIVIGVSENEFADDTDNPLRSPYLSGSRVSDLPSSRQQVRVDAAESAATPARGSAPPVAELVDPKPVIRQAAEPAKSLPDTGAEPIALVPAVREVQPIANRPRAVPQGPVGESAVPGLMPAAQLSVEPREGIALHVATTAPKDREDLAQEEIENTVFDWASAWSSQNVEAYVLYYAEDFQPDSQSWESWRRERTRRITRPSFISIEIDDLKVRSFSEHRAVVVFSQNYTSNHYEDSTRKVLFMARQDDAWRISHEMALTAF